MNFTSEWGLVVWSGFQHGRLADAHRQFQATRLLGSVSTLRLCHSERSEESHFKAVFRQNPRF